MSVFCFSVGRRQRKDAWKQRTVKASHQSGSGTAEKDQRVQQELLGLLRQCCSARSVHHSAHTQGRAGDAQRHQRILLLSYQVRNPTSPLLIVHDDHLWSLHQTPTKHREGYFHSQQFQALARVRTHDLLTCRRTPYPNWATVTKLSTWLK